MTITRLIKATNPRRKSHVKNPNAFELRGDLLDLLTQSRYTIKDVATCILIYGKFMGCVHDESPTAILHLSALHYALRHLKRDGFINFDDWSENDPHSAIKSQELRP